MRNVCSQRVVTFVPTVAMLGLISILTFALRVVSIGMSMVQGVRVSVVRYLNRRRVMKCKRCTNDAEPKRTLCRECADKNMAYVNKFRRIKNEKGICTHCREPIAPGSKSLCIGHIYAGRKLTREFLATLPALIVKTLTTQWRNLYMEGWDDEEAERLIQDVLRKVPKETLK